MKTQIEPFRIKVVEPIRMTTRAQRASALARANNNLFQLEARDVLIDLLTDSGTSAMSAAQWSAMMRGDESYAGGESFFRFEKAVRSLTGYKHVIPTHQGRAAERILFGVTLASDSIVPSNTHFDTTRANTEHLGATALDLPCPEAGQYGSDYPFKGNTDLVRLADVLEREHARIPLIVVTVTNNSGGGQPVSLENLRKTSELARRYKIPMYLDAARFAENAYLIKMREPGQGDRSVVDIAREMFSLADGCTMSAKKDALVNIGGFVATQDESLAEKMRNLLILTEGFPTYGGMAGRDLEAIATGLEEVVDEDYLAYRLASSTYAAKRLSELGIPFINPVGIHALYIDAAAFLPHVAALEYPGQALALALYLEGGIRSVEIGGVMFGAPLGEGEEEVAYDRHLLRLAFPRRVYTQSHFDYVLEVIESVWKNRADIPGVRISWQPRALRHFTAHFEIC